jgi:hypothetical protein
VVFVVETNNLNEESLDSAMRTEKLHNFIAMPLHRPNQRGSSLIISRIHIGSPGEQQIHHVHTTCLRCQIQWRGASRGSDIHFGPFIKQHLRGINVTVSRCQMQSRPPSIVPQIDIARVSRQILCQFGNIAIGGVLVNRAIIAMLGRNQKASGAGDRQQACYESRS